MPQPLSLPLYAAAAATSATAATAAIAPRQAQLPPFSYEIRTLSNRADLVSDGDALVEVLVPKNVPLNKVTLLAQRRDVAASFVADARARARCAAS